MTWPRASAHEGAVVGERSWTVGGHAFCRFGKGVSKGTVMTVV
jgi:hypothetical protein